jgi:hypothetical protein
MTRFMPVVAERLAVLGDTKPIFSVRISVRSLLCALYSMHRAYEATLRTRVLACRLIVVAAVTVAVGAAPSAYAQGSRGLRDAIAVDAGATCLDAETLVEHVRSWLGSAPVAADVSVQVQGSPGDPRVVGFRALRGGQVIATRDFDPGPASCEHLHAAVGLAIAMALSASFADGLLGPAVRPPEALPSAAPADTRVHRWSFGASAVAALDVLPGAALGLDARFEYAFTASLALRFGLVALAGTPGSIEGLGGHYDSGLLAARGDVCAGDDLSPRVRIQGCAGFAGGAIVARGHSFTVSQTALAPWTAIANEVDLIAALGRRWGLDLALGVILPLQRMSLVVHDRSGAEIGDQPLGQAGGFVAIGVTRRF